MEYWREQGITPAERQQQALIAELIQEIGFDLARECPELRADDSHGEFRERAAAASRKLFAHIEKHQKYWRLAATLEDHMVADAPPVSVPRSFLTRAIDWLRGRHS